MESLGRMTDAQVLDGREIGSYQDPLYGLSVISAAKNRYLRCMEDQHFGVGLSEVRSVRFNEEVLDRILVENEGTVSCKLYTT